MRRIRHILPVPSVALLAVLALTACGGQVPPPTPSRLATPGDNATANPTPPTAPATPGPAAGQNARTAYSEAICPAFESLALLDPRLAALRAAEADGVDVTTLSPEIELVADELRQILNDLAAVPDWTPGVVLRNEVIRALHELRVALVSARDRVDEPDAPARLAAVPYVARPAIDVGMQQATDAGFVCSFN